jgi:hypothetical protein
MASNFNYPDIPMQETNRTPPPTQGSDWAAISDDIGYRAPQNYAGLQGIADRSALTAMAMNNPVVQNAGPVAPAGTPRTTEPAGPSASQEAEAWRAARSRQSSPSRVSSGSVQTGPIIPEPTYDAPTAPKMPDYTPREYAPPEEDKGYEKGKRRELMGAGQRELRQRTQEAIVGARSLSNPAARKDFVRSALAGFGSGLESVSRGATGSAATLARQKRADDLTLYNSKFKVLEGADITNYQNEINRIAADFASAQWGAQQKYATQKAAYMSQPQGNIAASQNKTTQGKLNPYQTQNISKGLPTYMYR